MFSFIIKYNIVLCFEVYNQQRQQHRQWQQAGEGSVDGNVTGEVEQIKINSWKLVARQANAKGIV